MLDVAGGPGSFSIALALRYPNLRCTVADLPNVVANTRTYIERYQCQDRVDTHAFNMFEDAWPSGYDAIFFSNIFHDWDAHRRTDLANLAFAALPAGGRILIHEMLLNDAADGPLAAALFSVLMLGTRGKQFAYRELEELVTTAGFADVRVTHTYGYYSLVSATKRRVASFAYEVADSRKVAAPEVTTAEIAAADVSALVEAAAVVGRCPRHPCRDRRRTGRRWRCR